MRGQRAGNTLAGLADLCGVSDWLPVKAHRDLDISLSTAYLNPQTDHHKSRV